MPERPYDQRAVVVDKPDGHELHLTFSSQAEADDFCKQAAERLGVPVKAIHSTENWYDIVPGDE